jgi:DHA2 family multidrug resistance protein
MTDGHAYPSGLERWVIAVSVMSATFMEVLDTTVVNVSLPHISGSLSATIDEATWVLTSYLVANAIILPLSGWLANHFGRKRLLTTAVVGFTVASFGCGLAPNLTALIIFRIVQGLMGGSLQPLSQAVLLETFPPEDRGKAMGFWGLGIVVAPIFGPVLGGWLTDSYSWRWVFYINLPVGVLAVLMIGLFVHDPAYIKRRAGGIDHWGIGLLALGVGALQYLLDTGQEKDWFGSTRIRVLAAVAAVSLVVFIVRELTAEHPVIDLHVFRLRTYTSGVILMTSLGFVLFGSLVLLPIMLQTIFGYPALEAGIAMAPRGVGSFLFMPLVGLLTGRWDARKLVVGGLLMGSATLFWLGLLDLNAGYWDIFWPQLVQGVALSLLFVPLTTITMDPIPREQMGNATALFNLMRNLGGSAGIAASSTLLVRHQQEFTSVLGANVTPYNPAAMAVFQAARARFLTLGGDPVLAAERASAAIFGTVQRQASMVSFVHVFQLLGFVFLILLPLVLIMKRPTGSKVAAAGH